MGRDCVRYIEIYTEDKKGYIDKKYINTFWNLKINDVILVYNNHHHYFKIIDTDADGEFVYEIIKEPDTIEEAANWKIPEIAYAVEYLDKLPKCNIELNIGDIYKVGLYPEEYYKWDGAKFIKIKKCPSSWKPIKYNDKLVYICTSANISFLRDCLDDCWGEYGVFSKRGLPGDITDEIKKEITDGNFNLTYCTLEEIDSIHDKKISDFKHKLLESYNNQKISEIDKKIDLLLKSKDLINSDINEKNEEESDEEYDEYYDSPDYIFDEYYYETYSSNIEYTKINTIVNVFSKEYISEKNIRIIYGFNN